jgi:hypothetical protein
MILLFILLTIYMSLPVSSANAERSFFCLKRLKTYLRSTMGQERLSALAILNIEVEELKKIDLELIINQFASASNRNLTL